MTVWNQVDKCNIRGGSCGNAALWEWRSGLVRTAYYRDLLERGVDGRDDLPLL
jgi:hypothetical protein